MNYPYPFNNYFKPIYSPKECVSLGKILIPNTVQLQHTGIVHPEKNLRITSPKYGVILSTSDRKYYYSAFFWLNRPGRLRYSNWVLLNYLASNDKELKEKFFGLLTHKILRNLPEDEYKQV